jgi:hypothetical protein
MVMSLQEKKIICDIAVAAAAAVFAASPLKTRLTLVHLRCAVRLAVSPKDITEGVEGKKEKRL